MRRHGRAALSRPAMPRCALGSLRLHRPQWAARRADTPHTSRGRGYVSGCCRSLLPSPRGQGVGVMRAARWRRGCSDDRRSAGREAVRGQGHRADPGPSMAGTSAESCFRLWGALLWPPDLEARAAMAAVKLPSPRSTPAARVTPRPLAHCVPQMGAAIAPPKERVFGRYQPQ